MIERPVDISILTAFSPLDGLKAENLHALARKTQLRELDSGRALFKEGETEKRTFYLVSGTIELRNEERVMTTIRSGTPEARQPLVPVLPRKFTARAMTDISYIMIDSDLLDVLITWDQTGQYEVAELNGDQAAMTGGLDDRAAANQGVPSHSPGQHPGDFHAHAADQLPRARRS